jgi:hypothetical protein
MIFVPVQRKKIFFYFCLDFIILLVIGKLKSPSVFEKKNIFSVSVSFLSLADLVVGIHFMVQYGSNQSYNFIIEIRKSKLVNHDQAFTVAFFMNKCRKFDKFLLPNL